MKNEVAKAAAQIKAAYPSLAIQVYECPCGGAFIFIEDFKLGPPYRQTDTWVGFFISNACPFADTYPFYIRPDLSRLDGKDLKNPIHITQTWATGHPALGDRPAVMVSRRQQHQNCIGVETPLIKLQTVMKWLLNQ